MVSYFVSHLKQFFNCYPSHNKVQEILNNLIILPSNINLLILSHLEEGGTSRVSEKRRHWKQGLHDNSQMEIRKKPQLSNGFVFYWIYLYVWVVYENSLEIDIWWWVIFNEIVMTGWWNEVNILSWIKFVHNIFQMNNRCSSNMYIEILHVITIIFFINLSYQYWNIFF